MTSRVTEKSHTKLQRFSPEAKWPSYHICLGCARSYYRSTYRRKKTRISALLSILFQLLCIACCGLTLGYKPNAPRHGCLCELLVVLVYVFRWHEQAFHTSVEAATARPSSGWTHSRWTVSKKCSVCNGSIYAIYLPPAIIDTKNKESSYTSSSNKRWRLPMR